MATAGSARVLGFQDKIGRIAPGAFADLVLLDLRHITYVPLRDALLQVLNGEGGAAVNSVMVGGELVLREGRMVTVDEDALRREAEAARDRLDRANAEGLAAARALEGFVGLFCLAHARNALVAHAAALVAIGGGAGTLSEVALAWVQRRLVIAFRLPG